jgi:hypothetical protein
MLFRQRVLYHTVPLGRIALGTSSRHFMPGYLHSVPPGQLACDKPVESKLSLMGGDPSGSSARKQAALHSTPN